MIILDENILEAQRLLLQIARVPARQIGVDLGQKGWKDERILVWLRAQRNVTFFTRDLGFYKAAHRHPRFCLAVLQAGQSETVAFVRRFLRHPDFRTHAKRAGMVVRIAPRGLSIWRAGAAAEDSVARAETR